MVSLRTVGAYLGFCVSPKPWLEPKRCAFTKSIMKGSAEKPRNTARKRDATPPAGNLKKKKGETKRRQPLTTKQIQEAEERFWDWLKNLESYFLYKPEIRKHEVCHNANTELCEKCQEPECDLAKGWFKKRKGGAGR